MLDINEIKFMKIYTSQYVIFNPESVIMIWIYNKRQLLYYTIND